MPGCSPRGRSARLATPISDAGLLGGGAGTPRPGEVSLAHNGALFPDELPKFPRNVLERLSQPIEEGGVTVAFPARFMLLAAMNACPCGQFLSASSWIPKSWWANQ